MPMASHGVGEDTMSLWGVPRHAIGGTMATPAATAMVTPRIPKAMATPPHPNVHGTYVGVRVSVKVP